MKKQYHGNELKILRNKYGLTQQEISRVLEVNYRTYLNWEYDQCPLNHLTWEGIIKTLSSLESK